MGFKRLFMIADMVGIDPKKFMGFVFVKNALVCCSVIRRTLRQRRGCVSCQMWNARLVLHHIYVGAGTLLQDTFLVHGCSPPPQK